MRAINVEAEAEEAAHQLGSLAPWSVDSAMSAKNWSTVWPMLTVGSSRELLATARMRRSYEDKGVSAAPHRIATQVQVSEKRTFSSMDASGPPPPSPFPNASSAVSLDSRFCRNYVSKALRFWRRS